MLRVLGSILLAFSLAAHQGAQRPPLTLKPGDTVAVTSAYGGEFTVQSDGAVYGKGFRAVLEGKTVEQAQAEMRRAMRPFVPETEVFVSIKGLRQDVVYVVGPGGGKGPVPMATDLTLRQVLANTELGLDADKMEAQLYRDGTPLANVNVASLLQGAVQDVPLRPNDVVTLSPVAFLRVWVLGQVAAPGEVKVPIGSDVYKSIAVAGGFRVSQGEPGSTQPDEVTVTVRRGPETFTAPLRQDPSAPSIVLQSGDTVTVQASEAKRVTVLGEVRAPGEFVLRGNTSLMAAVAAAGGPSANGTLATVLVYRKGELLQIDATAQDKVFNTEQGDLVYVRRNERAYYVLGDVASAGKVLIKDGETPRVTDALAAAGGLSSRGTLRRVYLAHPEADGHLSIALFNLDDYLKGGDVKSNPVVQPGDSLLFGQPKGITLANAVQVISAALLFENLIKK